MNETLAPVANDPFGNPLDAVTRLLVRQAQQAGVKEIAFANADEADDGDYRVDIEYALATDGILPIVADRAAKVFERARLGSCTDFPLRSVDDPEVLLGRKVQWVPCGQCASALGIALACMSDAFTEVLRENGHTVSDVLTLSTGLF